MAMAQQSQSLTIGHQFEGDAHVTHPPAALTLVAPNNAKQTSAAKPSLPPLLRASHLTPRTVAQGALPTLKAPYALTEIMVDGARDGAASAFAAALSASPASTDQTTMAAAQKQLIIWAQDSMSTLEAGMPHMPGFSAGLERLAFLKLRDAAEVLWAMEEALLSGAAQTVIGEIWGAPKALSFTATKRLQRAAQIGKTPALLLRYGSASEGTRPASGAHERWVVTSQPSALNGDDAAAPGVPGWHLDRFKTRLCAPSQWTCFYDRSDNVLTATDDQQSNKDLAPPYAVPLAAPLAAGTAAQSQ
ncbi:MAG: hypothetical protein AAF337_05100 [Pseudomonadota bacterium]